MNRPTLIRNEINLISFANICRIDVERTEIKNAQILVLKGCLYRI